MAHSVEKYCMTPVITAKRYKNMRRYVYSIFVCLLVLAACSPRFSREQTSRTTQLETKTDSSALTKHIETAVNEQSQQQLETHEWTEQVTVWEQLSQPDTNGVQHVTQRTTTTTSRHAETSAVASFNRAEQQLQQLDSTSVEKGESALMKEEEEDVTGDVKGFVPWYEFVAALIAALLVVFFILVWIKKKL